MRTRTRFLIATSAALGVIAAAAGWTRYEAYARHHPAPGSQHPHAPSDAGGVTDD